MAEREELIYAALTAAQNAERQIPGAVSAWLEENVDPETGYVLDSSLTVAGAAADAKAAGDAVGELKSAVNDDQNNLATVNASIFRRTTRITIPGSQLADGYALTGTGLCASNSAARLAKWQVTAGSLIWIRCPKTYAGVYQFQSDARVPSTGTNNNLVGTPVTIATDGIAVVPSGASWVILSYPKSGDSTSGVYNFESVTDDIVSFSNLIGMQGKLLYPVNLPTGTTLTMATADREALGQGGLNLLLFDADKNQVEYWGFPSPNSNRTITITHDAHYVAWDKTPAKNLQLNIGSAVLDYAPYALNITDPQIIGTSLTTVVEPNATAQTFNSSYHTGAKDFSTKCAAFSSLMCGDTMNDVDAPVDFEAFLFFTDPHLVQSTGWEAKCYELITQIQKYYNSTPTTFCLSGGDWLGDSDTPAEACYKLGYIDGFMHSKFDNCHMLVGNHDTNYQGKKDAESSTFTTRLSEQSIVDLWYRQQKKAYGFFDGASTKFYYFDTGTERQALTSYNNYGMRQAEYFANALLSDNSPHIVVIMHILHNTVSEMDIHPLPDEVLTIAEAYNGRTSVTLNGNTYDYTSATGKIEFGIFGHTHTDYDVVVHGIPCVVTTWVRASETEATFDLVFVDYDSREIKMIRVGSGDDRVISLD